VENSPPSEKSSPGRAKGATWRMENGEWRVENSPPSERFPPRGGEWRMLESGE
jgi:hypothetical protein